jgi:hypothetical protein
MLSTRLKILGFTIGLLGLLLSSYAFFIYDTTTATANYAKYEQQMNRGSSEGLLGRAAAVESTTNAYLEFMSSDAVVDPDRKNNQYWMFGIGGMLIVLALFSFISGLRETTREQDQLWETDQ